MKETYGGAKFEEFIGRLLKHCFKEINAERFNGHSYDFEINGEPIEVKYLGDGNLSRLPQMIKGLDSSVLVVSNCYYKDTEDLQRNKERWSDKKVILLNHLLHIAERASEELIKELNSCLDFSTEGIIRDSDINDFRNLGKQSNEPLSSTKRRGDSSPKFSFDMIEPGKMEWRKYEEECKKLVEFLFDGSLKDVKEQEWMYEGMKRYDLVAKIKDNPSSFWKLIYDRFKTNFIVFEAKNWTEKIDQNVIYLSEKYLFDKALRNVMIIFTRKGADDNAVKAQKGALRGDGKLFIILNDDDVKKLIKTKENNNSHGYTPSDYLLDKANELLMDLDR